MEKTERKEENQKVKGIIYIILSAFFFALMNAFVRLSGDLPSVEKSFFRNLVAAFVAFILLKKDHIPMRWQKGNLPFLLIRSVCGTLGILGNFYAIDHLVLADASMLNKMSPFFAVVFAALFLKEKCKPVQAAAIMGAFIGSLFIIKPTFTNMELIPSLIGFAGGLFAGAAYTAVRYLGLRGENGRFIVFFFSAFSCIALLPYILFHFEPMTMWQLLMLLMAGVSATGGQFSITAAYCYAAPREISVYDYSQILFSTTLGYFLFGQSPDGYSIIGYVIICAMAIGMFFYNQREDRQH